MIAGNECFVGVLVTRRIEAEPSEPLSAEHYVFFDVEEAKETIGVMVESLNPKEFSFIGGQIYPGTMFLPKVTN